MSKSSQQTRINFKAAPVSLQSWLWSRSVDAVQVTALADCNRDTAISLEAPELRVRSSQAQQRSLDGFDEASVPRASVKQRTTPPHAQRRHMAASQRSARAQHRLALPELSPSHTSGGPSVIAVSPDRTAAKRCFVENVGRSAPTRPGEIGQARAAP
jgi:hypothetical protein